MTPIANCIKENLHHFSPMYPNMADLVLRTVREVKHFCKVEGYPEPENLIEIVQNAALDTSTASQKEIDSETPMLDEVEDETSCEDDQYFPPITKPMQRAEDEKQRMYALLRNATEPLSAQTLCEMLGGTPCMSTIRKRLHEMVNDALQKHTEYITISEDPHRTTRKDTFSLLNPRQLSTKTCQAFPPETTFYFEFVKKGTQKR